MILRSLVVASLAAVPSVAWNIVPEKDWFDTLQKHEYTLAAFIWPEDKECKAFEPEYAALPGLAKEANIDLPAEAVVAVDCTQSTKLCRDHDVRTYPAIRLYYPTGYLDRYRGRRKAKDILGFVKRATRSRLPIVGAENVSSFKTIDDVVIIGARLAEGSAARDSFKTVASKYRDVYSFALTAPGVGLDGKIYTEADDAAAAAATTVASQELVAGSKGKKRKPGRGVACYHNRDQTTLIADDTDLLSPSTLERFVRRCAEPLVPELNRRNEDELLMQGKSVVYFFHWSAALRATFRRAALPLAKRYEEYLTFCTADSYEFQELYPKLGMGNDVGVAGLTVQNPGLGTIYPYRGDGLSTWMQELWDAGVYEADTEPTAEVPELVAKMRKLVEDFVNDIVEGRIESIKAKTSKFTGRRVVEAPEEEDSKKVDGKEEKVEEKQETTGKEEKQEATGKEEKQEPIGHEEKHDANAQAEATVEKTSEKVEEPTAEPKHDEL